MSERLPGGRVAVYPGTFDPFHNGHLDVARRAAALFDAVIVAVYARPAKRVLFDAEERIALARASLAGVGDGRVRVEGYADLTVQFARSVGACALVRGLRTGVDFDYESGLTAMNRLMVPEVETVFLMTSPLLAHLSATLVKEVARGGAAIDAMVPPPVAEALRRRLAREDA
jgi:pantetheine-phosphate adenylyltransferase